MSAQIRYIISDHKYHRHATAHDAYTERERLQQIAPGKDFKVLTIIDEPKIEKTRRDLGMLTGLHYQVLEDVRKHEFVHGDSAAFHLLLLILSVVLPAVFLVILILERNAGSDPTSPWIWAYLIPAWTYTAGMMLYAIRKRAEAVMLCKGRAAWQSSLED